MEYLLSLTHFAATLIQTKETKQKKIKAVGKGFVIFLSFEETHCLLLCSRNGVLHCS